MKTTIARPNTFRSHCTQIFVRKYILLTLRAQLDIGRVSNSPIEAREKDTRSISRGERKEGWINRRPFRTVNSPTPILR